MDKLNVYDNTDNQLEPIGKAFVTATGHIQFYKSSAPAREFTDFVERLGLSREMSIAERIRNIHYSSNWQYWVEPTQ